MGAGRAGEDRRRNSVSNGFSALTTRMPIDSLCAVPRPVPTYLQLKCEAQASPDRNDYREHPQVLQRGLDSHCANDISNHQELQAEQNRPPEIGP